MKPWRLVHLVVVFLILSAVASYVRPKVEAFRQSLVTVLDAAAGKGGK